MNKIAAYSFASLLVLSNLHGDDFFGFLGNLRSSDSQDKKEKNSKRDEPKKKKKKTEKKKERRSSKKENEEPLPLSTVPRYFEPVNIGNHGAFHINGDVLYWKFYNNGMPFAMKGKRLVTGEGEGIQVWGKNLKVQNVSFKYDLGWRVGLGYTIPYGEWDFNSSWTHFYSQDTKELFNENKIVTNGSPILIPLWAYFDITPDVVGPEEIKADMSIHFDTLDLEMSRFFFAGSVLAFKPILGVKASQIEQKERIITKFTAQTSPSDLIENLVHLKNEYKGIGLRSGFDLRFIMPRGFEFYGTTFYSLLMGHFNFSHRQGEGNPNTPSTFSLLTHNRGSFRQNISVLELAAGLKWGTYFGRKKCYLSFRVGYEQQTYINFNQLQLQSYIFTLGNAFAPSYSNVTNPGDLSMRGLVGGFKFFF